MQINLEQQDINNILAEHLAAKGLIPTGQVATFLYQNRRKNGGIQAQVIFNTVIDVATVVETEEPVAAVVADSPVVEEVATPKLF